MTSFPQQTCGQGEDMESSPPNLPCSLTSRLFQHPCPLEPGRLGEHKLTCWNSSVHVSPCLPKSEAPDHFLLVQILLLLLTTLSSYVTNRTIIIEVYVESLIDNQLFLPHKGKNNGIIENNGINKG